MENPIKDIERYNLSMRKSMIDKIFFLDKIEADVIIDFGCADGSVLKFIRHIFPELILIGYDIQYSDHYTLPYIRAGVWKDFYVQLQERTHLKLILRKVKHQPRGIKIEGVD